MTDRILLGGIADDYTGATDLSSMLVRAGLRVIQFFGVPSESAWVFAEGNRPQDHVDAVVIALKTRSIDPQTAIAQALSALNFLQSLGCNRFYFKYCSTFDSTPKGNIGPVAESLARALRVSDVWYCPAFPENGRTVVNGHCFVHGIPLHESGMQHHPLHPMTNSNLISVLQPQCQGKVGLITIDQFSKLPLPSQSDLHDVSGSSVQHWILDSSTDDDLKLIAAQAQDHRLLTGSSAMACPWAKAVFADQLANESQFSHANDLPLRPASEPHEQTLSAVVVLAGSCSPATRVQVSNFAKLHPVYPLRIAKAELHGPTFHAMVQDAVDWVLQQLKDKASAVLVTSGWDATAVDEAVQVLGDRAAAEMAEAAFGEIACALRRAGVNAFIVAGGETSGAVINALHVSMIRIGKEIAPGVPCVYPLHTPPISLVLKSGNFGGPRFFDDAIEVLRQTSVDSEVRL